MIISMNIGFVVCLCWFINITKQMKKLYSSLNKPTLVAPDAVDLSLFKEASKTDARKQLNIKEKKVVTYTGQLFPWKGVQVLVSAAESIDAQIMVVGGSEKDIKSLSKNAPDNVSFVGQVEPTKIPLYLAASDVLVLPNTKTRISESFTSPLKLFEYMTSGRAIVASDLPAMREIIDDDMAYFFEAGNSKSLAAAVGKDMKDKTRAKKAKQEVKRYGWDARAQAILDFLEKPTK
jgi:glycosyltransferase involved in cell wall biosynthesis